MDGHQRRMWQRALNRIDAFERGQVSLAQLVADLRGLYVEADPHDPAVRNEFEGLWSSVDAELELRTASWAPPGSASDKHLREVLDRFRAWVSALVSRDVSDEHR